MSTFIPTPRVDSNVNSYSDANNITVYTVPVNCYAELTIIIPNTVASLVYINYPSGPSFQGSATQPTRLNVTLGPGGSIRQQTAPGYFVSVIGVQFRNG